MTRLALAWGVRLGVRSASKAVNRAGKAMENAIPRVVVVNDDPAQLELISHLIEQEPAEVFTFYRATDALAYISQAKDIDLVVTDLHMPGIDGWRFCHILRSPDFPRTNKTPILIVSATLSKEDVGTVPHDIGADAFLSMPYTPNELQDTVHKLLFDQQSAPRPSVLIVAKHPEDVTRIAVGFAEHGYQTLQASERQQALALFREHQPGVVVLDHSPPEVAGQDLIPQFKASPRTVVLVTTDGLSPELVIGLTQQGADTHLTKPYEIEDLITQVTRVQRGRAMLRVETTLESLTKEALRNARRIQRLNDCFLSLGTDHDANIRSLVQTAGELLAADVGIYDHHGLPEPYSLAYRSGTQEPVRAAGDDRARCIGLAHPDDAQPVVARNLSRATYADKALCTHCPGIETLIECTVLVEGRHVGSLCVGHCADYAPSDEDLNLVQLLARVIGRQEQLGQRERELIALNRVGRTVTSTLTLDEVLLRLRHEVRDVIGAEVCSIALIDPATDELVFRQADDPFGDDLVGRRLQPGQGIAGLVAQTGQSILVPNARADPRFYAGIDEATGLESREIICAPLRAKDATIGVIEIVNKREGALTTDDVRLLESVAAQTAFSLENARLHEATERELAERIRAEQALRESKTRLQTFVDVTPDLIYLKDRALRYLLVNRAFADYWAKSPDEIIGCKDESFIPQQQAQTNALSESRVMSERRSTIVEEQRGGRTYEIRRTPVVDEAGQAAGIAGVIRDITERKRLQEQLIREQKEESILTLATGIVHDFNNALVGIVGNIDILRVDLPLSPETDRTLNAMEASAQRMVDLTNQLLAYAGGGPSRPQRVNLNTIVNSSLEMLQVAPDISVQRTLADDLWSVKADANQIKQVLLNLLTNACEAMVDGGGTLSVETTNAQGKASANASSSDLLTDEYVCLTVGDTGHGMDSQVKKHLFEPFFSTKFLGRGLGLAAAQGIVRDHGGAIDIESTPQQGTIVRVSLPRHPSEGLPQRPLPPASSKTQMVLVIEDEPVVRSMVERALRAEGYEVILARDGTQALTLAREYAASLNAVLLDLGLPGTNGRNLFRELRVCCPDTPVLLTSGYTMTAEIRELESQGHTQFLQKPFSLEELRNRMRELLSALG